VDRRRELVTLEALERRRQESSENMWLAPVLTMTAQAFLLQVLSKPSLGWLARVAVLAAGLAATIAALWSLLRAHAREVQYSEAIAEWTAGSGYIPDVRPSALHRPTRRAATPDPPPQDSGDGEAPTQVLKDDKEHWVARWDRHIVWWGNPDRHPKAYMVWALALMVFLVADIAVLLASV
jgi:hypothetical protein